MPHHYLKFTMITLSSKSAYLPQNTPLAIMHLLSVAQPTLHSFVLTPGTFLPMSFIVASIGKFQPQPQTNS
jgi:hypothetical protein